MITSAHSLCWCLENFLPLIPINSTAERCTIIKVKKSERQKATKSESQKVGKSESRKVRKSKSLKVIGATYISDVVFFLFLHPLSIPSVFHIMFYLILFSPFTLLVSGELFARNGLTFDRDMVGDVIISSFRNRNPRTRTPDCNESLQCFFLDPRSY